MARTVNCIKLGKEAEGLDFAPYPGELGKRIWESVSKEAWAAWLKHQTMLVNENRLNLADARARQYLARQMENHFFGDGADAAQGHVPPSAWGQAWTTQAPCPNACLRLAHSPRPGPTARPGRCWTPTLRPSPHFCTAGTPGRLTRSARACCITWACWRPPRRSSCLCSPGKPPKTRPNGAPWPMHWVPPARIWDQANTASCSHKASSRLPCA